MINRRRFLVISGFTLVAVSAGSLPALAIAGSSNRTISLAVFNQAQGETLLYISRALYPHSSLQDGYYLAAVESFDKGLRKNATLAASIKRDLLMLAGNTPDFAGLTLQRQTAALDSMQDTTLFDSLRQHLITALYNNPDVWTHFGYQGPSFAKGGYLERGFNDISWLPKP